jgi:putative hydrolase of the HAD superfamily
VLEETSIKEGARDLLEWLKERNYKIAVISNGDDKFIKNTVENFGIRQYLDVLITSEGCGAEKSTLKPFRIAIEALKVSPSDVLVIGDRIDEEILAANKFGMKSVLMKGSIWEGKNYSSEEIHPNYSVNEISEVKRILGDLSAND